MPVAMLSSSLITEPKRYGRFNALDTENPFRSKPGMVLVSPTSIDHSGTSATLGANGQVTFSAVTSLSLNGVFSADFDNYLIVYSQKSTIGAALLVKLRASGTDTTGSDYTSQRLLASSGTVAGARFSSETSARIGSNEDDSENGEAIAIYGPALSQPTAMRNVSANTEAGAVIADYAATHSLSSSYDGCTFFTASGASLSGKLAVYGVRS